MARAFFSGPCLSADVYNENDDELMIMIMKDVEKDSTNAASKKQIMAAKKELLKLLDEPIYFNDVDKVTSNSLQQSMNDHHTSSNGSSNNNKRKFTQKAWKKRSSFFVYNPFDK